MTGSSPGVERGSGPGFSAPAAGRTDAGSPPSLALWPGPSPHDQPPGSPGSPAAGGGLRSFTRPPSSSEPSGMRAGGGPAAEWRVLGAAEHVVRLRRGRGRGERGGSARDRVTSCAREGLWRHARDKWFHLYSEDILSCFKGLFQGSGVELKVEVKVNQQWRQEGHSPVRKTSHRRVEAPSKLLRKLPLLVC